jgi:shikimate dehydrogenase
MEKPSASKIYGVLGFPAKHSLSPLMHNAAFRALNINSEYKIFEIGPQELNAFMASLSRENICGLNVTAPYKEKAILFLDRISPDAKLIQAVNTIKVSDNNLEGFNTDAEGFLKHLTQDLGFDPAAKNIAIIGAGGAGKAVSVGLSKQNPRRISIYDADGVRLLALVNHLKDNFNNVEFNPVSSTDKLGIADADLLVNATPNGMKASDYCLVDEQSLHNGLLVYDLIYDPKETKLLALAKKAGANTCNGLMMLLYQAMLAFEIWTGQKAPKEVMLDALFQGSQNK